MIILLIYAFVEYANHQKMLSMKSNPPPITVDEKELIDRFKVKPQPEVLPSGKYYSEVESNGEDYKITYYFGDNNTITKEVSIWEDKYELSGSAKYHFVGSVLVFTDIAGDKALFSELGEAISVVDVHNIILDYNIMNYSTANPISLRSYALVQESKILDEIADAKRRAMLESKSIFELSLNEALKRVLGSDYFIIVAILLFMLPVFLIILMRLPETLSRAGR